MIEVVFSNSACGTLKLAQRYGTREYSSGIVGLLLDGEQPSEQEIETARCKAEGQARREWETTVLLGGNPADVYCLDLALSIGEITEDEVGIQRQRVFGQILFICPMDIKGLQENLRRTKEALAAVCARSAAGEAIRIWYSHNPDELCGLYWLMAKLHQLMNHGPVYLIKLPEWEVTADHTVIRYNGWGEVRPGECGRYAAFQRQAPQALISGYAMEWRRLQEENAPLRVVLNGQLVSAPEDIYDEFILRELAVRKDEFLEAYLIADVMGKYQLGIGDAWLALRIETMVQKGILEVVKAAPEDGPVYRRMLRKCSSIAVPILC